MILTIGGGVGRSCHRPQNKQICLPQNEDFLKTVLQAAELIFAGAVEEIKKNQKRFL